MGKEDDTPPNMDLLVYKIDELREGQRQTHEMFSEFMASFNTHIREDTIMAEQVRQMMEEKRSNAGIWSGLAGAATGIGAFVYAIFGGGK